MDNPENKTSILASPEELELEGMHNLSIQELNTPISFDSSLLQDGQKEMQFSLIGRFLTDWPINLTAATKTIIQTWNSQSPISTMELADGYILFKITTLHVRCRIIDHQPLSFYGYPLLMIPWSPNIMVIDLEIHSLPVWVQAHSLPQGYFEPKIGAIIGGKIGAYMDSDIPANENHRGQFFHIRIKLDVRKPLRPYIMLSLLSDSLVDGGAELQDEDDGRRMHRRPLLPREDDQEDFEALERRIQARYAKSSHTKYDEETTDVEQQALLPSVKDPKLWMVKCTTGHEREAAICLMQKYIDKGSELQIRSAIALDHLKNYIYVEQVVDVDNVHQRVTVKLIPRIDLQALANKLEGRETVKKKAFVPSPRFMNIEEAREMHIRVERRLDRATGIYFESIGGTMFKDSFLYKTETLYVNEKNLCKYFKPGDHVKVVSGAHEGATGMVVKVEGFVLIILSDTTKEDIRMFAYNVVESSEVTSGITRIGDYELHDLVLLGNMSFGVIVHVESETFQVLKGVPERPEGKQGPVEHIYRRILFLYDRHHLEHAGYICAKAQSCVVIGGSHANSDRTGDSMVSRMANLRAPPQIPQPPRRLPRGGPPMGDAVDRNQISDNVAVATPFRETLQYGLGSETPMHPSRTPLHPYMTPMRDPGATPIHDGMRTPMRDRAWNPYAPMSPTRDNWEVGNPASWGTSTHYQPGSPRSRPYEGPTPGSGWANTPSSNYSEAGTPRESSPVYANAPSPDLPSTPSGHPMTPSSVSYLPGTPGGQPMTPGSGSLDVMSPTIGVIGIPYTE
ncbi:hypothetical protein HHK36_004343 [Tetracentron sinense]|uniref:KOW domain-containing protein n=1 Tax=Tetracentron sinense TaxID=13715 RepID=A0A835DT40_TETSI|nr:hypothetical protein HHK36_004343 [Tetracentron sinense]